MAGREIPSSEWELDFGYDYDLDADLRWNHDRTGARLEVEGLNRGVPVVVVLWSTAEGWEELRRLFESGDDEAVWDWHDDHIESVREAEA